MPLDTYPLPYLSVISFEGHDAGQFLQRQLSSDVLAIPAGQWGFGCHCNPAGRVLGLLALQPVAEGFRVLCGHALADSVADGLQRFVFRDDVKIRLRDDLAVRGVKDPTARTGEVSGLGYVIEAAMDEHPAIPGAVEAFRAAELASGICWLQPETSAQFLPQMLGFESIGALSFRKGCYPGQEIIARTRYLGKLKRHPVVLSLADAVETGPMTAVMLHGEDEEWSAVWVDAARDEQDATCALVVARGPASPAVRGIEISGRTYAASVVGPRPATT